jgi:hypothetical protein
MTEVGTAFEGKRYAHRDEDFYKAVEKWLKLFEKYLPLKDASEHARGAHDAVNDLLSWVVDEPIKEKE